MSGSSILPSGHMLREGVVRDEALDAAAILSTLEGRHVRIEVVDRVDSTNRALLERSFDDRTPHALIAGVQTAGRGRRGREWIAVEGGSLCLSLAWWSRRPMREIAGIGVAAGVACAEALCTLGVAIGLKWPNDLLADGRKLGGILAEARAETDASVRVVVGIGINCCLHGPGGARPIDQPWTDLASALGADPPSRNVLAATLLPALLVRLHAFETGGLAPLLADWRRFDVLADRPVRVLQAAGERRGIARGLDRDGALRVEFPDGIALVRSGEVSVRA